MQKLHVHSKHTLVGWITRVDHAVLHGKFELALRENYSLHRSEDLNFCSFFTSACNIWQARCLYHIQRESDFDPPSPNINFAYYN